MHWQAYVSTLRRQHWMLKKQWCWFGGNHSFSLDFLQDVNHGAGSSDGGPRTLCSSDTSSSTHTQINRLFGMDDKRWWLFMKLVPSWVVYLSCSLLCVPFHRERIINHDMWLQQPIFYASNVADGAASVIKKESSFQFWRELVYIILSRGTKWTVQIRDGIHDGVDGYFETKNGVEGAEISGFCCWDPFVCLMGIPS